MSNKPSHPPADTTSASVSPKTSAPDQVHAVPEQNDKDSTYFSSLPHTVKMLLACPPVLQGESKERFLETFEHFANYVGAETTADYVEVGQVTVLAWECMRYNALKVSIVQNYRRKAMKFLIAETHQYAGVKNGDQAIALESTGSADKYFSKPELQSAYRQKFAQAGFSEDAINSEAFRLALPTLTSVERLVASAEKRLAFFLRNLEKRNAERAKRLRAAAASVVKKPVAS